MEIELDIPVASTANLNHCETCDGPKKTIEVEDIRDAVSNSNTPKLLRNIGPYVEVDKEVLDLLNTDFRIHPKMLPLVPKLFTGALIYGESIFLVITTEVYSRHASIDMHLETAADSVPSSTSHYKNRLLCTVLTTADGRGLMKKLIIGSKTVNLLVTCSADIVQNGTIYIGPRKRDC